MYLKQIDDEKIVFGTDERRHVLELKPKRFKPEDVDAAAADLLAAFPKQEDAIARYAARLKEVLR